MKCTISGIRGVVGKDLKLIDVIKYCNKFSNLISSKKCVIACDVRTSSIMIKNIASAALMYGGINVYDLGTAPTPIVFKEAREYGAAISITASHNPIQWNGIKFNLNGKGINQKDLDVMINSKYNYNTIPGKERKIRTKYIKKLYDIINYDYKYNEKHEMMIDAGGGTVKTFVIALFDKLGCKTKLINDTIRYKYHNYDPIKNSLTELISITGINDLGFAFDLDGDRLIVIKNKKKQIPDTTLGLCIARCMKKGHKKFTISIDTSNSIEKFIKDRGGKCYRSKVGEINVMEKINKTNSDAGGEGSCGGFILPKFKYCRDAILASGLIASMNYNDVVDIIGYTNKIYQHRYKLNIKNTFHKYILNKIYDEIKFHSEIITLDGLKIIIDENEWMLVRKSNTENVIRISIETDKNNIKYHQKKIENIIMKSYEKIKRKRNNKNFSESCR